MRNLFIRAFSGLIYVIVIVGCILLGKGWFAALMCLLCTIGMYEMERMVSGEERLPRFTTAMDIAIGVSFILSFVGLASNTPLLTYSGSVFLALLFIRPIVQLYIATANPIKALSRTALSFAYVAIPLAFAILIYTLSHSAKYLLLFLLIFIWMNDTGAYCVGCLIGRHRLFERISPKKSWEGFFGGVIFSIVSAVVIYNIFPDFINVDNCHTASLTTFSGLALLTSICATYGDLVESMIKRTAGVKDSGNIIPGHGGVLDRIDSLLLVLPVAFFYIICFM